MTEPLTPEEYLKVANKEEDDKKGHLKVFFGMCAGVGKTYAMLEQAHQKQKAGLKVLVGVVNSHGRKETEALLDGLEKVPEKEILYRDILLKELNLEEILKLKPDIVLVDELAHTNAPGSRHNKRWQDVLELIENGIDVYSTLNVQHVESRKGDVEKATGVEVKETVPDSVLEKAYSIEYIDLPPEDLLKRLDEGKVYTGKMSRIAVENFFKKENLSALRDLGLRLTAEKVEHDLHAIKPKGWKLRDKLMVAVSPSFFSEELIRATRKRAFELDAPWVAVYVDQGKEIPQMAEDQLKKNLSLARDLGAEVVQTRDSDVAQALSRVAQDKAVTLIVIGRSYPHNRLMNFLSPSLLQKLERKVRNIDILILHQSALLTLREQILYNVKRKLNFSYKGLSAVFSSLLLVALVGWFLKPYTGYRVVGFLFLANILILSFYVGFKEILFAALLSAIIWNFFFIPPVFHPFILKGEDIALLIAFFILSVTLGLLMMKLNIQDRLLLLRERTLRRFYEIERSINNAVDPIDLRSLVTSKLSTQFPGYFDIIMKDRDWPETLLPELAKDRESAIIAWTIENGKPAGLFTDTLPLASALFLPIKDKEETLGVLAYIPPKSYTLSQIDVDYLTSVASRLGMLWHRKFNKTG